MQGFFDLDCLTSKRQKRLPLLPRCGTCGLYRKCKSPKMKYSGKGRKKILVVGEAPGADEDKNNEQFVGKAGERLEYELKRCGIILNRDCWKTNAVRCRPPENKTDTKMMMACRPALFKEIGRLKPHSILLFGGTAAQSVLGNLWEDEKISLTTWMNWIMPNQELNSWISVHYHPSYLERQSDDLLDKLFRRGLKRALKKDSRPWDEIPKYEDKIEIIHKPSQVVKALREITSRCFSFDYEANTLKPEYEGSEIVSCSVCWNGRRTYSFPWMGENIDAMIRLLKSPLKKVAANMKFEHRWTYNKFGFHIRNWDWDTMLASHVLNFNPGVTGLKFQSFVRLGIAPYNKHIEPFLKAQKGQHINRIRDIPLDNLLEYGGMDSLCEYKVMTLQKQEMKNGIRKRRNRRNKKSS